MQDMLRSISISCFLMITIFGCSIDEKRKPETIYRVVPTTRSLPSVPTFTPTSHNAPTPTPAPIPTSIPFPSLSGPGNINIRSGPGTSYPIMQLLEEGKIYRIIGQSVDDLWWQIIIDKTETYAGESAWVYKELVNATNTENVPVAIRDSPSPTPASIRPVFSLATPTPIATRAPSLTDEKRKGLHCLSYWDGHHREFNKTIKDHLNDPSSFKPYETRIAPVDRSGNHTIFVEFGAKNAFNAMMRHIATGLLDNKTCEVVGLLDIQLK